jgi:hypothetical protein
LNRRRSILTAAALVLLASVAFAACGGKVIDDNKAEEFIRQDLSDAGVNVESVSCPSGVEVAAGSDFECDVAADGERAVVQMRIVDDEGLVKPITIRSADAEARGKSKNEAKG